MQAIAPSPVPHLPALVSLADDRAQLRFLEFFAVTIRNPRTRRTYGRAVGEFLGSCSLHGISSLAAVQPLHVATWIEQLGREVSAPTVKQQFAGVRHLFDWLVTGQEVLVNPAASVRGPAHSFRRGKTPVLDPKEARALLDAIDVTMPAGLRDRALIGLMVYSFAPIGAALAMRVEDVFAQNRRLPSQPSAPDTVWCATQRAAIRAYVGGTRRVSTNAEILMSDEMHTGLSVEQIVNVMINPLANVLNQLIAVLAAKGVITKEEAIGCIASAAGALDDDRITEDDGEVGRDMLIRMIKAIDGIVEPERPLANHVG